MKIEIGFENGNPYVQDDSKKELTLTEFELSAYNQIIALIKDNIDISNIRLERCSNNYISLFYGEYNDFVRFKLTERTKWISIRLSPEDLKSNVENPLFSAQKNKRQLHWKATINSVNDITKFKTFLVNSCNRLLE